MTSLTRLLTSMYAVNKRKKEVLCLKLLSPEELLVTFGYCIRSDNQQFHELSYRMYLRRLICHILLAIKRHERNAQAGVNIIMNRLTLHYGVAWHHLQHASNRKPVH